MPKTKPKPSSLTRSTQHYQISRKSSKEAARDLLAAKEEEAQMAEEQEAKALLEANIGTLEHIMNDLYPPLSMSEILELYHPMDDDDMSEKYPIEGIPYEPRITLDELEDILKEKSLTATERVNFRIFMEGLAKDFDEGEKINREKIEKRIKREQNRIRSIVGEGEKSQFKERSDGSSSSESRRDRRRDRSRDTERVASGRKLYKTRNKKSRRARKTRRARNTRKARR